MKICIVGPGIMPIPPVGWGAVEILIWDYKVSLEKLGHEVIIVNSPTPQEIVDQVNNCNADFVHFQYDNHCLLSNYINCPFSALTSHYGYLDQRNKYNGYEGVFNAFLNHKKSHIFALSPSISKQYTDSGFDKNRIHVIPNGVRDDLFRYNETCLLDKSIYLAKVDYRKRQYLFQNIPNLYFAGNIDDQRFDKSKSNYLGEWNKSFLYDNLTNYANLVLLSDGEAHPLVCLEAMSAGLGLVISEWATANLDISLPFIDVIPENKISDIEYVSDIIEKNRKKSISMRGDIRKYVVDNFSWDHIVSKYYIPTVEKIINN